MNNTERMEVIAEVAIIQYERTVPAGLYEKERSELKAIILSAITEATAKQSEEIEALRETIDKQQTELMNYAVDICPDQDRIISELQSELSRIKEGNRVLVNMLTTYIRRGEKCQSIPPDELLHDRIYLDNLMGGKK